MHNNPYQSPAAATAAPTDESAGWKAIAARWERLRLFYNGTVALMGLAAILSRPGQYTWSQLSAGILAWTLGANLFYLLGPVTQMYLSWFAERNDNQFSVAAQVAESSALTWLLFISGLGFSLLLTAASVAA